MSRYFPYLPEQAYLLPPNVAEELGSDHLCFFVRQVVRRLDMSGFEKSYSPEGGMLYAPELMLSVWLYAYATGMTSARRLSQRLGEDLALRYLSGGARVDNWALSAFRRRHAVALNSAFTQVLEMARSLGLGKLGRVAIDSRGSKPMPAGTVSIASKDCATNELSYAATYAAGSRLAIRTTPNEEG